MPTPYLSLVIPTFGDAQRLHSKVPSMLEWLNRAVPSFEVIFVDDGSPDPSIVADLGRLPGCQSILLPGNQGKGAAVRTGMLAARGQFRIFTDADIPFELEALERILRYLDFKEFDLAVGDRTLPASNYLASISRWRNWSSRIFTFVVGRFVTTGLFDTQCGLKGFRESVAQDLFGHARINGFAFDVELIYLALKRNYDIKRLPVTYCGDQDKSSVRVVRHGFAMLVDLIRIKGNHLLGRYNAQKVSL